MPIFEYSCDKCEYIKELLLGRAKKTIKCPICLSRMKRLIGAPSAHFKGSGFYATDYKIPHNGKIERELSKAGLDKEGRKK